MRTDRRWIRTGPCRSGRPNRRCPRTCWCCSQAVAPGSAALTRTVCSRNRSWREWKCHHLQSFTGCIIMSKLLLSEWSPQTTSAKFFHWAGLGAADRRKGFEKKNNQESKGLRKRDLVWRYNTAQGRGGVQMTTPRPRWDLVWCYYHRKGRGGSHDRKHQLATNGEHTNNTHRKKASLPGFQICFCMNSLSSFAPTPAKFKIVTLTEKQHSKHPR